MFDQLREIITYTYKLGFIETVKITGTKTSTQVDAIATDNSVVVRGTFNQPITEFDGVFGLPNLDRLNIILDCPEYKEDAKLSVGHLTKEGIKKPASIKFENKAGDFVNEYRLMSDDIVNGLLPNRKFNQPKWDVTFAPSQMAIQKLKYQAAAAGSEETSFVTKVEHGNLKFYIGDHSTHAGNFVFESNLMGTLKTPRHWPLKQTQAILNLTGDKVMAISDAGAMMITVTTGLAVHNYVVMALTK